MATAVRLGNEAFVGDDVWQSVEATIDRSGELEFRADDIGHKVEAMFGTNHYVYWRAVAAHDVSKVFVALKHDLFRSADDFDIWVRNNKRVKYAIDQNVTRVWPDQDEYQLWRRSNPRDAANGLLELLQERFGTGADFEDWLKEKGIDGDFCRAIGG